jgi:CheY-like chemotaxis protein
VLERTVPRDILTIIDKIGTLEEWIHCSKSWRRKRVTILHLSHRRELRSFEKFLDLLHSTTLILALPDEDDITISRAHRFRPSFIDFCGGDFTQLAAVVEKIMAAESSEHSRRILLVEDDRVFRAGVESLLKSSGYDVSTAADGREALKKIAEAGKSSPPFDLLITDIVMPVMDGLELLSTLMNERVEIPSIVLSSRIDDDCRAVLRMRGCEMAIEKPFPAGKLVGMVEEILAHRRHFEP